MLLTDPFADVPAEERESVVCAKCGTSQADLYSDGRMGCAECYKVFAGDVRRALIVIHSTHRHVGKNL